MGECISIFFNPIEPIRKELKHTEPMKSRYFMRNDKIMLEIRYDVNNIDHIDAITYYVESRLENSRAKQPLFI